MTRANLVILLVAIGCIALSPMSAITAQQANSVERPTGDHPKILQLCQLKDESVAITYDDGAVMICSTTARCVYVIRYDGAKVTNKATLLYKP